VAGDKIKQRLLATESNRFDGSVGSYAIQVEVCGRPEQIAPGPLSDKSEGKIQPGAPKNPACYLLSAATCCRTAAIPAPSSTASIMASQPMQELIIMWYSRRSVQSRS